MKTTTFRACGLLAPLLATVALTVACGDSTGDDTGGNAPTSSSGGPATNAASTSANATASATTGSPASGTTSASASTGGGTCAVDAVQITHAEPPDDTAKIHSLDPSTYPEAVCNDGSPGAFVVRRGAGGGAKRWLLYLEGGGACGTGATCAARWNGDRGLMTGTDLPDGAPAPQDLQGIKSNDPAVNPDFYDANFVQLLYCSSDAWSGDVAGDPALPVNDVDRWHFRGRKIAQAVVETLLAQGLDQADEVLLLGSSAGGMGVYALADDLGALLPATTRLVALADAGFIVDYPAYDETTMTESTAMPTQKQLELAASAAAWEGRGDASCDTAAASELDRLLCRSPANLVAQSFITTPTFVRQSQLDAVQLKQLIPTALVDASARAYRERFATRMRELLDAAGPGYATFSQHDKKHGVVNEDATWTAANVDGVSLVDAVGDWYRDPCAAGLRHVEVP